MHPSVQLLNCYKNHHIIKFTPQTSRINNALLKFICYYNAAILVLCIFVIVIWLLFTLVMSCIESKDRYKTIKNEETEYNHMYWNNKIFDFDYDPLIVGLKSNENKYPPSS